MAFMKLSHKAIEDFKKIWKEEFREDITDEFAKERAEGLMRLVLIALKPQPWDAEYKKKLQVTCKCWEDYQTLLPQRFDSCDS